MAATNAGAGLGIANSKGAKGPAQSPKRTVSPGQLLAGLKDKLGLLETFLLAGFLFLIPIITLLYFLVSNIQGQIAFSDKERLGIPYLKPLTELVTWLPRYTQAITLNRNADPKNSVATATQNVDQIMAALQKLDAEVGGELGLHERWGSLRGKWQNFKTEAPGMSADLLRKESEGLRSLTLSFLLDAADQSNLTLDPDVDTYYLQNVLANGLPALTDELADVTALAAGYAGERPLPREARALLEANNISQKIAQISGAMERSFAANDAVKVAVRPRLTLLQRRMETTLGDLTAGLSRDVGPSLLVDDLAAMNEKTLTDLLDFQDVATQELARLLDARISGLQGRLAMNGGVSIVMALLALVVLTLLARSAIKTAAAREAQANQIKAENQRNQAAILRLLDEMAELAEGNLTIQAEVTADFTGAIADSVNYTVAELRNLVSRVNSVSTEVADKTRQVFDISRGLIGAADNQAQEIQDANGKVELVAASAVKVSKTVAESESVARRSLQAADKGAEAVESSIKGMNDIRDQIQETAKRIKRLGESSQEIGEIIDLITDITEQTNVLALNAAIQAAAAGEAGRSFAVVAEEVQRLAERSGEATQQIGTLIRAIQRDTQEAVAAMERSTHGVVEGAKLSDATGSALNEIRGVSQNMANLIDQIRHEAEDQATAATEMARRMDNIMMVTLQTSKGTKQASDSVSGLTELANTLKASVAGFRI